MKKFLPLIVLALTLALFALELNPEVNRTNPDIEEVVEGTVLSIEESESQETPYGEQYYQVLNVQITAGSLKGKTITVENGNIPRSNATEYQVGDALVITRSLNMQGGDVFSIVDYVRRPLLFWLFAAFVLVTVLVSGKQGIFSLLGMGFSFLVLFRLVFPLILMGYSPVWAAIGGSLLMIPVTFYLSHGVSRKTSVAVLGTLLTLVLTGVLASVFAHFGHLSGLADEAAAFLKSDTGDRIDFHGLLLAGILISMLGILDDISISQASVAEALQHAKRNISFFELYSRTMKVGRDHIASMVNTLVLVYAGASLPLLLLFIDYSHTFSEVLNYEFVAEEVIQTLVGSMGLILTVPITTLMASALAKKS